MSLSVEPALFVRDVLTHLKIEVQSTPSNHICQESINIMSAPATPPPENRLIVKRGQQADLAVNAARAVNPDHPTDAEPLQGPLAEILEETRELARNMMLCMDAHDVKMDQLYQNLRAALMRHALVRHAPVRLAPVPVPVEPSLAGNEDSDECSTEQLGLTE